MVYSYIRFEPKLKSLDSYRHAFSVMATLSSKQWKYCQHPIAGVHKRTRIGVRVMTFFKESDAAMPNAHAWHEAGRARSR